MKRNIYILITIFCLSLLVNITKAQDWDVPAEEAKKQNPIEYNLDNVKRGKILYDSKCKSCHGDAGKYNALPLQPPPPDVTSDKMQSNTEGELFYKITHGKGGMPQFGSTLSEDDRWRIVNYIENYNSEREQLLTNAPAKPAKIDAELDEDSREISITAFAADKDGDPYNPIDNKQISLYKKTYFGKYKLGDTFTDNKGKAKFNVSENEIGDEDGVLRLIVELGEEYKAEETVLTSKIGVKKESKSLIVKDVLWSTNDNTSLWLVLTYVIGVLSAWAVIFYVIFQIVKIARLSKK